MTATEIHIPTLETARLRMRAPDMGDFEPYAAFCASERARGVGGPFSRREAFERFCALIGQWHLRGYGRWVAVEKASEAPVGVVGIMHPEEWPEPEIAWSVFEDAEGRGFAHEAAEASRRYAYDVLGLDRMVSCTTSDNVRSIALARRLGAERDGSFAHPVLGELLIWRHPAREALA